MCNRQEVGSWATWCALDTGATHEELLDKVLLAHGSSIRSEDDVSWLHGLVDDLSFHETNEFIRL